MAASRVVRVRSVFPHSQGGRPRWWVTLCCAGGLVAVGAAVGACNHGTTNVSANTLLEEGLAAQHKGNLDLAKSDYKAAIAKDPNNAYAYYDLGTIYQQEKDVTGAANNYRRTLALDPNFPQAIYNLAVLEAPTNPSQAITLYEQDLRIEPSNASANFNLGVLLIQQGQIAVGDSYLETGLRLNPALSADVPPGISVPSTTTPKG